MKIIVDHARCQGHATCMLKAPKVFKLNEDGYNDMPPTEVPAELEQDARLGVMNCPEGAIRIVMGHASTPDGVPVSTGIEPPVPFRIEVPDSKLRDIIARVAAYRHYPPPANEGDRWLYGVNSGWLRALCEYWVRDYDWRTAENDLNRYPQFVTAIDGIKLHFVCVHGETRRPRPLLLLHGWPGSHWEFWRIAEALAFPSRHGGSAEDAFDLVIPSLPGYGFSGPTPRPVGTRTSARLMNRLMTEILGYQSYMVQGGDLGALVGTWLGIDHSSTCRALHLNLIGLRPSHQDDGAVGDDERLEVRAILDRERPDLAYALQHGTRPQTLAMALMDSPVGTAGWILDKFHDWSQLGEGGIDEVYTRDELLTNIMIYLVNDTIATSLWSYRGMLEERVPFANKPYCLTPTAVAKFPFERVGGTPPRSWVERYFNIVRWTEMARGGHFAALEQPELLVADIRVFGRETFPG